MITLEEAKALPDMAKGKAIYFLWRGDELLYIGASTQIMERINRQAQLRDQGKFCFTGKPQIPFDRATILKCASVTEMVDLEKALIKRYWPPYNERCDDGAQVFNKWLGEESIAAKTQALNTNVDSAQYGAAEKTDKMPAAPTGCIQCATAAVVNAFPNALAEKTEGGL